MITHRHVHLNDAHKTPQFWLIWLVLCMNVSAGIGIIGAASPMLQETFGGSCSAIPPLASRSVQCRSVKRSGRGRRGASSGCSRCSTSPAAFSGLRFRIISAGRSPTLPSSCWASRLYVAAPTLSGWGSLALFAAAFCLIASMYGGGFATVPAYLADIFGTQFVGAIHGRLLTAWSTAGIIGPVVVNYLHDTRKAAGRAADLIYEQIFYVLAGMLVIGFVANLLIRPVPERLYMSDEEVAALHANDPEPEALATQGIGGGSLFGPGVLLAWAVVGIPLAWGVWITLQKAITLFQ